MHDELTRLEALWKRGGGTEPACEGRLHGQGGGHDGGRAAYAVTQHCVCGFDAVVLLCAGRVTEVLNNGLAMQCGQCGTIHTLVRDFWVRIVPLQPPPVDEDTGARTRADDELLRMLELDMRARACRPRSISETLTTVRAVGKHIGKPLADATRDDLVGFLTRPGLKPYSIRTYRSALTGFYGFLAAEGIVQISPAARLPKVRVPHSEPNPLTTVEVQRLLDSGIRRRTRMMVLLAAYQGLRAVEIAHVHGSAVNWTTGELTVRDGKGGTELIRPLHPIVLEQAGSLPRDDWWFPGNPGRPHVSAQSVSSTLAEALRRCGITGHRPHQLRAWHATELVAAGVDTVTVQHSMRHADLSSLHKYTKPSNDRIREAITALPALRP